MRPLEADLAAAGAKTIIYAPDRVLRYLPLAVLHDGDQWVVENYAIYNITSASTDDLNRKPALQHRILGAAFSEGQYTIAVDTATYPYSGLTFADDEIEALKALAPTTSLLNQDFSPAAVADEANSHAIVHLATHAQFEIGSPEHSFIVFGNGETKSLRDLERGWLNVPDVDLVVLSACETAVDGTIGDGAEILGFGFLMEEAGAKASLASLWKVDDGGTHTLMEQFYDALLRGGLSKAAALRQAQLSFIQAAEQSQRGFEVAYNNMVDNGFHHQLMRNMLHLNNGNGTFSEIGQFAGISNTDWSWSALFADYNNDGLKDLFVTNGYGRDMINRDFIKFYANERLKHLQGSTDDKMFGMLQDRKSTRLNSSHSAKSRMPSSA